MAELGHPGQQLRLIARAGVADVLDPDTGLELGPLRDEPVGPLRVDGHPVAVGGQAPAQLTQSHVFIGLRGAVAGGEGRVLRYQGDLHYGLLIGGSHHGGPSGGLEAATK